MDALEAATGAVVAPVLDVRVLLDAVLAMLPRLPPPPSAAALAAVPTMDPTSRAPSEAAAAAQLDVHMVALRDSLTATGLWSDRRELLGALLGRHVAALHDEMGATTGRDRCVT